MCKRNRIRWKFNSGINVLHSCSFASSILVNHMHYGTYSHTLSQNPCSCYPKTTKPIKYLGLNLKYGFKQTKKQNKKNTTTTSIYLGPNYTVAPHPGVAMRRPLYTNQSVHAMDCQRAVKRPAENACEEQRLSMQRWLVAHASEAWWTSTPLYYSTFHATCTVPSLSIRFLLMFEMQKVLSQKPLIWSNICFHHWLCCDKIFKTRSHLDMFRQFFFHLYLPDCCTYLSYY